MLRNRSDITQLCSLVHTWQFSQFVKKFPIFSRNERSNLKTFPWQSKDQETSHYYQKIWFSQKKQTNKWTNEQTKPTKKTQMWSQMSDSKQGWVQCRSLCSPLVRLNSSNLNAKSDDYSSLHPGDQPAVFLRSPWYTSFEELLSVWTWGEKCWTMHKDLDYSALHKTDQFLVNIARSCIKLAPFPAHAWW